MSDLDDAVLALKVPLRKLAALLARDEVESILRRALDYVFESEDD